jgi:hypothetical protein
VTCCHSFELIDYMYHVTWKLHIFKCVSLGYVRTYKSVNNFLYAYIAPMHGGERKHQECKDTLRSMNEADKRVLFPPTFFLLTFVS